MKSFKFPNFKYHNDEAKMHIVIRITTKQNMYLKSEEMSTKSYWKAQLKHIVKKMAIEKMLEKILL